MILVTGCNQSYYGRIQPYLTSLEMYADFVCKFIAVGFKGDPGFVKIDAMRITREQNAGAPDTTECIQHGSFLHAVHPRENEVLLYTDGDFVMQRPLDGGEKQILNLNDGQVVTSWNGGPHETLALEAGRLGLKCTMQELISDWGNIVMTAPIYNVGFIGMTRDTWKELYQHYMHDWETVGRYFSHQARQQWLISFLIAQMGLEVKIAPWSLHAHGHFGLKPGMERHKDGIYADGKLAAFRHYL